MPRRLLFFLLFSFIKVYAAFEVQALNPSFIARGGIISIHSGSLNPAATLENQGIKFRVDYSNLFGIKGLRCCDFSIGWGSESKRGASFHVNSLGSQIYQENTYGIGYCQSIRNVIALGVIVKYYDLEIAGYDSTGAIGLTFGSKFYLNDFLRMSLLFQNVNAPKICNKSDALPESFTFGIQWIPDSRVEIDVEIFKDTIFPFSTRVGAKVAVFQGLFGLLGVQLNPDRYSGGISFVWNGFQFDAAILHHVVLPYTFYFGCSYNI